MTSEEIKKMSYEELLKEEERNYLYLNPEDYSRSVKISDRIQQIQDSATTR